MRGVVVVVSGASDLDRRNRASGAAGALEDAGCAARRVPHRLCRCRNWSPRVAAEPSRHDRPLSCAVSGQAGPTVHAARSVCVRSAPDPSRPCTASSKPTWASAWWRELRSRIRNTDGSSRQDHQSAGRRAARSRTALCWSRRAGALPTPVRCSAGRWTNGVCRTDATFASRTSPSGANTGGKLP